jgi:hypothetical protein
MDRLKYLRRLDLRSAQIPLGWRVSMRRDIAVEARLPPVDDGTLLRIDHRGFEGPGGVLLAMMHRSDWRRMSRRLADRLRTQGARR